MDHSDLPPPYYPAAHSSSASGAQPPVFPEPSIPNASGQLPSTSVSGSTSGSGVQLTRDADLLIRMYLPEPTRPSLGTGSSSYQDSSRYTSVMEEKDRLRRQYEKQEEAFSSSSNPLSFPEPMRGHADLPLPLCIPQTSVSGKWDSGFARGYNDVLQNIGISEKMLLDFVDGLNLAITASPPLRVVDVVGQVIGFVPFHWAMIAGISLQTAAQTGMHVLSKGLTDRYLRAANLRLFQPRGLSVRLCKTPAMLALLASADGDPLKKSGKDKAMDTLNKVGRGVGTVLMHAPLPFSSRIVRAIADKPPVITPMPGETTDNIVLRRRLALVSAPGPELALPLRLEGLPPPAKPEGVMDMMSSWGLKFDQRKEGKKERQNEQRRRALQRIDEQFARGTDGYLRPGPSTLRHSSPSRPSSSVHHSPSASSGSFDMHQVGGALNSLTDARQTRREFKEIRRETKKRYKAERREARREIKNERRARRGLPPKSGGGLISSVLGPKLTPMQRRVANADLLEHWANEDVLWVVVMKTEQDSYIRGIDLAENPENEERIDRDAWAAEMAIEREELADEIESELSSSDSSDDEKYHKHHSR